MAFTIEERKRAHEAIIALEVWINAAPRRRWTAIENAMVAMNALVPDDLCLHIDPCADYIER